MMILLLHLQLHLLPVLLLMDYIHLRLHHLLL
jgi:hypothetical protein